MKYTILCALSLVFFTGCFNHTLPTVKRLDKGEEMWGASFGIPIFSGEPYYDDEEELSSDPAKDFSWSLWYGNGSSKYTDYYVYVGELGGIGILVNSEVRNSDVSSVVLNYGIGTVNGIYGFRPRIGINYSDGKIDDKGDKKTWKQIGFITGVTYDYSEENTEIIGDYELYVGLDKKKPKHFYSGQLGLQKVNNFSDELTTVSKWGPRFLSYKEWAKTPYHLNIGSGFGSIK